MNRKLAATLAAVVCTCMFAGCQSLFPVRDTSGNQPTITQSEPGENENEEEVIAPIETTEEGEVMYAKQAVNVRSTAGMSNSQVIGELEAGQKVNVTDKDGNWYKVKYDGGSGYVYNEYLSKSRSGVDEDYDSDDDYSYDSDDYDSSYSYDYDDDEDDRDWVDDDDYRRMEDDE